MPLTDRFLLIGKCMMTNLKNAVKVRITTLELDENLLMYFPTRRTLYAQDKYRCRPNPGDVVLIKELPQKPTKEITHEVLEVVYPLGNVIDPVSGKKVVGADYEDEVDRRSKLFGKYGGFLKYKDQQRSAVSVNEGQENKPTQKSC